MVCSLGLAQVPTLHIFMQYTCKQGNSFMHDTGFFIESHPHIDKGIASLARILRETETLKLQKLKNVTGEGVKPLASKALKSVTLKQTSAITDPGIIALVKNCPNIENLNLTELHKLTDAAFVQIAETLKDKLVSHS